MYKRTMDARNLVCKAGANAEREYRKQDRQVPVKGFAQSGFEACIVRRSRITGSELSPRTHLLASSVRLKNPNRTVVIPSESSDLLFGISVL
jgi:hypothetical protein